MKLHDLKKTLRDGRHRKTHRRAFREKNVRDNADAKGFWVQAVPLEP